MFHEAKVKDESAQRKQRRQAKPEEPVEPMVVNMQFPSIVPSINRAKKKTSQRYCPNKGEDDNLSLISLTTLNIDTLALIKSRLEEARSLK